MSELKETKQLQCSVCGSSKLLRVCGELFCIECVERNPLPIDLKPPKLERQTGLCKKKIEEKK
jgi:hypothetical protein